MNANIGMSSLLNVSDVLNYAGKGSRKFIEGENIVNSNHLMYCSITYECDEKTILSFLYPKFADSRKRMENSFQCCQLHGNFPESGKF